jgi:hypothetical protein
MRLRETNDAIAREALAASVQRRHHLQQCIDSLSNSSGRSLSSHELRIIIRLAMWLQLHHEYTEAAAIDAASVWSGSSYNTIVVAYKYWLDTGELLEPDTSHQGSGNPQHPRHTGSLSFEQILEIHRLLADAKVKNEWMPAEKLKKQLKLAVSVRQMRRILRHLGYRWRRKL